MEAGEGDLEFVEAYVGLLGELGLAGQRGDRGK
jgi:hypothetical protein